MRIMAGRSPVVAREEQRHELLTLSQSRERGGPGSGPSADPGGLDQPQDCRGLRGPRGYGPPLAQRFHERRGRGAAPIPRAGAGADQGERALEVAEALLSAPVADRPNWTLPRLADEIEKRSG